jgi:type IV pilus assembly protein PilW
MKPVRTARTAGFSLIELLVAMVIGLVVTLAITSVLIRGESSKRNTTSVNDLNQTGAYAAYVLDRVVRSAGSGFSQSWSTTYGCLLSVAQGGTAVLPTTIPSSSAFNQVTQPFRLAPVIIGKDLANTSGPSAQVRGDVLVVMGGTAGFSELQQTVTPGSVSAAGMSMQNALGYGTDDLVLLADPAVPGGCMVQQIATRTRATAGPAVLFGGTGTTYYGGTGTYAATTTSPVAVTAFNGSAIALQMGNAATNPPRFELYGVGDNRTLLTYDLLRPSSAGGSSDVPIADGVLEMRALYGITSTAIPGNTVDSWVDPGSADYQASVLMDGSAVSQQRLRRILAVRVGLILRTSLQERPPRYVGDPDGYQLPAGTVLTLFGDLGALAQTRTLGTGELNYRYRIVESTIPLRNVLLAPSS